MKMISKIALVLIVILLIIAGFHIYKTNFRGESSKDSQEAQVKVYKDYLEKQYQAYNESLSKANEEAERARQLNDKAAEQQLRYDKLLIRWEEQADKMDAILLKLEK